MGVALATGGGAVPVSMARFSSKLDNSLKSDTILSSSCSCVPILGLATMTFELSPDPSPFPVHPSLACSLAAGPTEGSSTFFTGL